MCGFVGIVNYKNDLRKSENIIVDMNKTLAKRGPDESNYYIGNNVMLGHSRLIVIDKDGGKQPMTIKNLNSYYTIVYNGQIYNTKELKKELENNNILIETHSDTELLLKSYLLYGYDLPKHLNGIFSFAIWDSKKEELFIARDHMGVKPLFYTYSNNSFIFSSEIKALFSHPNVNATIDYTGICELLGVGPAHTPSLTIYKDIYELRPGFCGIFSKYDFKLEHYWKLETKEHEDDLDTTCEKIDYLLKDSISKQLVSDVPVGFMLSGGLDSSIITSYASNFYQNQFEDNLKTFSVTYKDNDKNFVKSDFQPNSDEHFISVMTNKLHSNHKEIVLDTPDLAKYLYEAMIARDAPGMADVDSSMLLFCKEIKKDVTVVLSGECSDELFAGYPWFFREDSLSSNTFPWSLAILERQNLLNPEISKKVNLKEYIDLRYNQTLSQIEYLDSDSEETKEKRKISYLTNNWFMQTLLDRTDRMAMYSGLEVRVPFCDYRIAQYLWNIPWEMKALENREKGLLRHVVKNVLPEEIVYRKKSPYPKTHNPNYLKTVKEMLINIMAKKDAPIKKLLNENYINTIIETNGENFSRPWFGQLMTGPQLMAYIIQVNMWLEEYKPNIEI